MQRVSMIFDADSPGAPFSDLSAGVRIGETIFIAGDEGTSIERLVPGRRNSWTQTASYRLDTMIELPGGNADEIDIEGMAWDDGWLWVTGSHALTRPKPQGSGPAALRGLNDLKRGANRYLLARFPLLETSPGAFDITAQIGDRQANIVEAGKRSSALMRWIDGDSHIGPFLSLPAKENGFDVEGLAAHGNLVWMGLRGPVLRGHAVILQFDLRERRHGLLKARKTEGGRRYRKFLFDLAGLGVRDLLADDEDLLILTGPTMTTGSDFRLYRWTGAAHAAESMVVAAGDLRLEARMTIDADHGRPEAILTWTEGNVLLLRDGAPQRKSSVKITIQADVIKLSS